MITLCGRYLLQLEEEISELRQIISEVSERFKDTPLLASMKTGEVFPTNVAPVLVPGRNKEQATLMKWGFPKWQGKGVIINARSETAIEKKMFRSSLLERRCVVPTTGYFEWQKSEGSKKNKYLFRLPGTHMVYLAGFYETFDVKKLPYEAYLILTTAANKSVASYHERMPLVLEADKVNDWLHDEAYALDCIQSPWEADLHALPV